jgi:threonine dehydrogenase-like Zn-dependent dehydrogenase
VSCGTGTAYGALKRLDVSGRDTLAVFGMGPVGLSAAQLATAMGARVIALDVTPERRELARGFGAETVLDPAAEDPVGALKELTRGAGVDLALDCSGAEAARAAAIRASRTWGTVCFVGEGGSVTVDVSRDMIRKQLTVIGSWTFSSVIQAECARFIADRGIDVERLFTDRYTLDQAAEAYRRFDTQTTGKGVFLL